jgi:hypothetical protein
MKSSYCALATEKIVQKHLVLSDNYALLLSLIFSFAFLGLNLLDFLYNTPPAGEQSGLVKDYDVLAIICPCAICTLFVCAYYRGDLPIPFTVKVSALIVFLFSSFFIERASRRTSYLSVYVSVISMIGVVMGIPKFFFFAFCVVYVFIGRTHASKLAYLNQTLLVGTILMVAIILRLVLKRIFNRYSMCL